MRKTVADLKLLKSLRSSLTFNCNMVLKNSHIYVHSLYFDVSNIYK